MQPLQPLASDINRMIRYLSGAGAGMSLLSISTSSLPSSMIQSMMLRGARANDVVGALVDGIVRTKTNDRLIETAKRVPATKSA